MARHLKQSSREKGKERQKNKQKGKAMAKEDKATQQDKGASKRGRQKDKAIAGGSGGAEGSRMSGGKAMAEEDKATQEEEGAGRQKDKAIVGGSGGGEGSGMSAERESAGQLWQTGEDCGRGGGGYGQGQQEGLGYGQGYDQGVKQFRLAMNTLESLGTTIGQVLGNCFTRSLEASIHQQTGGEADFLKPFLQSVDAMQSNIVSCQSSRGELTDSSLGQLVCNQQTAYNDRILPKPLTEAEADVVLQRWPQQVKRILQPDFKTWMAQVNKDVCSLDIYFTGDSGEPDTGLKRCDFTLVSKSNAAIPVDTLAVFSLQSVEGRYNSHREIGTAIRRAEQVIKASGLDRRFCVAGVTNGICVQWFLVGRHKANEFQYARTPEYSFRESLCSFLLSKPKDLYHMKLEPILFEGKQLIFKTLLGYGATSKVYSGEYDGQNVAVKWYNTISGSHNEADVLKDLKVKGVKNVPTVVASSAEILIMKEVGEGLQYGVDLEQEYAQKMCNIVDILQAAHACYYVHRDVRLPNIVKVKVQGEADVMLIDWGFAARFDTEVAFAGSYLTASDNILNQLIAKKESMAMPPPGKKARKTKGSPLASTSSAHRYEDPSSQVVKFDRQDDLISLVRSLYLYKVLKKGIGVSQLNDWYKIRQFWEDRFKENHSFANAQNFGAACDYRSLRTWIQNWADYI